MTLRTDNRTAAAPLDRTIGVTGKTRESRTLTRAALCEAVHDNCPTLSRTEARKVLDATLEEISEALVRGEPVKLRAFGSFNVRSKRERIGRNPKTGEEAPISPRTVLTFRASPALVAQMNSARDRFARLKPEDRRKGRRLGPAHV